MDGAPLLSSGTLQSLGDPTKVLLIIQFKPDKGIALKHKPGSKKHKSRAYPQNYGWGFGKESVGDFNELLVLIGCNKLEMFAVFFHSFAISLQISPQNKNGQSKAKQSKAKQCEAKQSREKQNKAKQLNAKQCKAMQSNAKQASRARPSQQNTDSLPVAVLHTFTLWTTEEDERMSTPTGTSKQSGDGVAKPGLGRG